MAGASAGSSASFRGPTRRSSSGASDLLQLVAAMSRSASESVTCASFSASAKVAGDTCGPTAGAVPKVGGAPGGAPGAESGAPAADLGAPGSLSAPRQAATAPMRPIGAWIRNCRRVFTGGTVGERRKGGTA